MKKSFFKYGAVLLVLGLGGIVGASLNLSNGGEGAINQTTSEIEDGQGSTSSEKSIKSRLLECNSSTTCLEGVLQQYAIEAGPGAAIAELRDLIDKDGSVATYCHSLYEKIGRKVTETNGIVDYYDAECQFGYVHGVLYALGEVYDDLDKLSKDAVIYCSGYLKDPDAMNSPDSACYHGIGHAVADLTYNDPQKAITYCQKMFDELEVSIPEEIIPYEQSCADGVFMEYGDGNLIRAGLMQVSATGISTETKPEQMVKLCASLESTMAEMCYGRIWKFVGPGSDNYAKESEICFKAPTEIGILMCGAGFGELIVWTKRSGEEWPPRAEAEADSYAKMIVEECYKLPVGIDCIYGAMAASTSHLYAVNYDDNLIPKMCKYVKKEDATTCEQRHREVRELNWDQTNESQDKTGKKD